MRTQGHVASAPPRCVAGGLTWYAAFAWLLVGCPGDKVAGHDSGSDSPDVSADADGDGYATPEDCDDTDPGVNPGAEEICDGLDQDCDGLVDDDPVDGQSWYADADGDSYGDPSSAQIACDGPTGTVASNTDCDDGDPGVNPGATEVCDGVDQDCDGVADDGALYGDADGDGYGDADTSYVLCDAPADAVSDATDCDDTDSGVHPGASETWYDGVDTDCAGDDDYDADGDGHLSDSYGGDDCDDTDAESRGAEADEVGLGVGPDCGTMAVVARVYGEGTGDHAGFGLSGGDVNGDGYSDILVGGGLASVEPFGQMASYLVLGPVSGEVSLSTAEARIGGTADMSSGGGLVFDDPDLDGDGFADLLVQGNDASELGLHAYFAGPVSGALTMADADGTWTLLETQYGDASVASDTDGDGLGDLLVNWLEGTAGSIGGVMVATGPWTGTHDSGEATAIISGDNAADKCGYQSAGVGDVSGDGLADVAMSCKHDIGAALFFGPATGTLTLSDADALLRVDWTEASVHRAGDVNGDGYSDIIVDTAFAPEAPDDDNRGRVYLLLGPMTGDLSVPMVADTTWQSTDMGYTLGFWAGGADLDADGQTDYVMLQTNEFDEPYGLYFSVDRASGTRYEADADWCVLDNYWPDRFPAEPGSPGDVNADGYADLVIGTPDASVAAAGDGGIWLLQGGTIR